MAVCACRAVQPQGCAAVQLLGSLYTHCAGWCIGNAQGRHRVVAQVMAAARLCVGRVKAEVDLVTNSRRDRTRKASETGEKLLVRWHKVVCLRAQRPAHTVSRCSQRLRNPCVTMLACASDFRLRTQAPLKVLVRHKALK
jgi:hypothetical protein